MSFRCNNCQNCRCLNVNEEKELDILKLILFMALMLLIVEMSFILPNFYSGDMRGLVGTLAFFATFILMFIVIERFAVWDGTTLEKLGVQFDDNTIRRIIIGGIAGVAATALIAAAAYFFGGQLRPVEDMTADLLMSEIIITAPTALFEELAHRGYILPKMEGLTGKSRAILISSLFFSCLHFSWWVTPGVPLHVLLLFIFNIFLGGIVLSLSYYWSNRNLWVPIAFHFAWNMVGYILFPIYARESVVFPEIFQFEWGLTTIVGFLFGLSLIYSLLLTKKK
ncbi:MAG: CPBP family intramembrane metalloprotease [Candidatus Thorarchaeota archaeon]|nr:MAG: CPBP family intramembrane metalloprotease [Candidatus Thorarchaeota archaeon]